MRILKKFFKTLLFPHGLVLVLLTPLAGVLLIYVFKASNVRASIEYASYILSAYTLTAVCCKLPDIFRYWKEIGQKNKYVAKYKNNAGWQMMLSLYGSFAINAAYAVLQLVLGIIHATVWYYSMAAYYLMLSIMRFYLLQYLRGGHVPGRIRIVNCTDTVFVVLSLWE